MSLPRIAIPEYEVKLLSQKKKTRFRPYLVKEEKLLLMAKQSDDPSEVERTIKQIISACTFDKVDVEKLPPFDLAYLFLQLRAKSVNNVVDLRYICQKQTEKGEPCGHVVPISINLEDVKLTVPKEHTNKIALTDDLGVTLRYPTTELGKLLEASESNMVDLLCGTLDTIYTKEEVFECKEQTEQEIRAFVESLSIPQAEKLKVFFTSMPHLEYEVDFKCEKCGYRETIVLTELADFFD